MEAWLAADHGWSIGTERTYRSVIRTSVLPAFGQLTLQPAPLRPTCSASPQHRLRPRPQQH
jgi:hypothetical protein